MKLGARWLKEDLTGKRFGKLIVEGYDPRVYRAKNPQGNEVWFGKWLCRCDCGNHVYKHTKDLNGNLAKSCGCFHKATDMTGQVFGKLTVMGRDYTKKRKNAMWLCRCECGQERAVSGTVLRAGLQKSCGCQRVASMRAAAPKREIRRQHGIEYKRRQMFAAAMLELKPRDIRLQMPVTKFIKVKSLSRTLLPWECVTGNHSFLRSWYNTLKWPMCPMCSKVTSVVLKSVQEDRTKAFYREVEGVSRHGLMLQMPIEEFIKMKAAKRQQVPWKCVRQGHTFLRSWNKISQQPECPGCKKNVRVVLDPHIPLLPVGVA